VRLLSARSEVARCRLSGYAASQLLSNCHNQIYRPMPTPDLRVVPIVPAVMVSALVASSWSELNAFNKRQPFVQTHGSVTALDCGNHGSYTVTYAADGKSITGGAGSLELKLDCRQLAVGQQFPVWYSASDPAYASFLDPKEVPGHIKSEIAVELSFYPLVVAFLYLGLRFKLYTRRNR